MKKLSQILFITAVVGSLFLILFLTAAEPDQEISSYENRALASRPVLEKESFFSGKYFGGWETYLSDHIVRRDRWLKLHTRLQADMLKRPVVNGVVLSQDVLLPFVSLPRGTETKLKPEEIGDGLRELYDHAEAYGGTLLCVGLPEQRNYFSDKYPSRIYHGAGWRAKDAEAFFNALEERGVPWINMMEVFDREGRPEEYYFKTDHHYTQLGAYRTYLEICDRLKEEGVVFPVITEDLITWKELKNPFVGSRGRLLYGDSPVTETLSVYEPEKLISMKRTDNGEPVYESVFRLPEKEFSPVSYLTFMGGDIGHTVVDTGRDEMKNVLVVGNSFTNALETFLYYGFNEMHSLDLRHYDEMSVEQYIDEFRPDVVICVMDDLTYLSPSGNGIIKFQ